ncbi:hypothetical protein C41B8_06502 [Salinisphaera hydrothermalis C41B8]|uniref:DGQHR domain-containing protein n=1 Tax=Salinisphaera hydrothermalis (strain C41B8) TaxID=1304275 RepID=A0A084IND0_SALHC|nr:hypothetical protein C41B8_06502 [Salinisphaera hydrothermalis C41B8]
MGFQRTVNESRAKKIAANVIDQGRIFPNTIVLATDTQELEIHDSKVEFSPDIKFLIVDGQHRLWAQHFAKRGIKYGCTIHLGLSEPEMATLFVEINDTQKRVPASLRWDLVRLTRSDSDPEMARAADLTYDLSTDLSSPLFQRIDLTGEDKSKSLTQASIAPEIKSLIKKRNSPLRMGEVGYETQREQLIAYFDAIKSLDKAGWISGESNLYQNRVIRALLQLYPQVIEAIDIPVGEITLQQLEKALSPIDVTELDQEKIRGQQGTAGISQIRTVISEMLWGARA